VTRIALMPPLRRAAALAVAGVLILAAAACRDDGASGADPVRSASESGGTSSSPHPSPTEPAWLSRYSSEQVDAYEQAITRLKSYEQRSEPIWAAGRATASAEALFKEYFPSPQWRNLFQRLRTYQQVDVQMPGQPTVLWSKPRSVTVEGKTGSVSLVQCVDYTSVETTQYGKPVPRAHVFNKPVLRRVELARPKGFGWLIYVLEEPTVKDFTRCSAPKEPVS
jgi:hypothetical protein